MTPKPTCPLCEGTGLAGLTQAECEYLRRMEPEYWLAWMQGHSSAVEEWGADARWPVRPLPLAGLFKEN